MIEEEIYAAILEFIVIIQQYRHSKNKGVANIIDLININCDLRGNGTIICH